MDQSIVLKDNNAVKAVAAYMYSSQYIETNSNVAYGKTTNNNDSSYDDVTINKTLQYSSAV